MISSAIKAATLDFVDTLRGPTFWLVIACVVAICFISGPFGTLGHLPPGLRLIYWGLLVGVTGLAGVWTSSLVRTQHWNRPVALIPVSLAFGCMVWGMVVVFSLALLAPMGKYPGAFSLMLYSVPSGAIIFLVLALIIAKPSEEAESASEPERPRLFARLKQHCAARQVMSLSAQDHYVEVVTETGAELCLIRLADAIAEAAPEPGIQIHRSHWVARSAVEALDTRGGATQVRLKDGRKLPVSQSRLNDIRSFLAS